MKNSTFWKLGLTVWVTLILLSCSRTPSPTPTPSVRSNLTVTPYQLATAQSSSTPAPIITSTQEALLPSPTPFLHTIQAGDTLIAIALQYNVTLDDLVAANPGINSNQLTIGAEVIIPGENGAGPGLPTPTPLAADLSEPDCYRTGTGGLDCFFTITNPLDQSLENISILANLHRSDGDLVWSEKVIPPLDTIAAQSSLPAAVRIPPPIPEGSRLFVSLLTALPGADNPSAPQNTINDLSYGGDRRVVQVTGTILLPESEYPPGEIWLAAVVYDQNGKPVGVRKWISGSQFGPGDSHPFTVTVYSAGPRIEDVKVFSELH